MRVWREREEKKEQRAVTIPEHQILDVQREEEVRDERGTAIRVWFRCGQRVTLVLLIGSAHFIMGSNLPIVLYQGRMFKIDQ